MLEFFQALVTSNCEEITHKALLNVLIDPVMGPTGNQIHKQGRASIAKCTAALVTTQSEAEAYAVVDTFAETLTQADCQPHRQTFALLAIGEIGKHL